MSALWQCSWHTCVSHLGSVPDLLLSGFGCKTPTRGGPCGRKGRSSKEQGDPSAGGLASADAVPRAGNPRAFKVTVEVIWRPGFRGQEYQPFLKISQPASLCPPAPKYSGKMDGRGLWASRVRGSSCWSPEPGPWPGAAPCPAEQSC